MAKARKAKAAKKAKKAKKAAPRASVRRAATVAAPAVSVGPIWKAIAQFEKRARALKPQPAVIADALASLEKAKAFIPACAKGSDGEFEFILLK